ncbi:MAG TPA: hypothetical protein VGI42_02610, partial [Chthoniobacterales bacterium]
ERSARFTQNPGTGQGKAAGSVSADAHTYARIARIVSGEAAFPFLFRGFEEPGIIPVERLPELVD